MSGQRSDVGFVELDLEGRSAEESAPIGGGRTPPRAQFHDLRPDGSATKSGLLPTRVAKLQPWHRRTLRIALAMKGGLSLAVWIGGAVAELDILRRIRLFDDDGRCRAILLHKTDDEERLKGGADPNLARRAAVYAQLLRSRGYDRVEFDVLAGASAGGLNGVLYAVAQRAGVGFDTMLDTWLRAGSAWGLLQTGEPSRFDAVMRGDGYFWPQLSHEILRIIEGRDPVSPLRCDQVVVDLSATLLDAVDSSDRTTAEGRAQFRFVGGRDPLPDRGVPPRFTDPLDAHDLADIARIAYAARSTSSFPFIFEPALIYSGREALASAHGWAQPRDASEALDAPDMRMVFNAHREDAATHPFRVADGGLLDNIPIDRALNAVRNMPADEHSNRAILYLDPSPKETAALFRRPTAYASSRPTLLRTPNAGAEPAFRPDSATVRDDVGSRVMSTIVAALRKRSARESRDEEIEEVDLVRATTSVAKARNELLADRINGDSLDSDAEANAALAYAGYRAASDFELLAPPLLHPGEWMLGTDLEQRPELVALDRLSIVHVETAFRDAADRLHDPASKGSSGRSGPRTDRRATASGRQAMVDASMAVLSWIRAIEQTAFQEHVLKEFDANFDAWLAPAPIGDDDRRNPVHRDDPTTRPLPKRSPRARVRRKLSRVIRDATLSRDAAILATLEIAKERMNAPAAGGTLRPGDADAVVAFWMAADARGGDNHDRAWGELDDIVDWLLRASDAIRDTDAAKRWLRTPWSRLTSTAGHPLTARQLPLLFGGSGIPQPISSVRFHRIGSDVQPAHPLEYRRLMEDQLLRGYRSALARRARELDAVTVGNLLDEQNLRSTAKLAGLRAANIAGFLSRDWRLNDWWWGRLDAGSGIVEFFSSLPAAPEATSSSDARNRRAVPDAGSGAARMLERVHDELLAQLAEAPTAAAAELEAGDTTERRLTLLSLPARRGAAPPQATRERFVRGTQGFDALSDSYRVAIFSRTLRAASSALTHGERMTSPKRFLHWLLRPIAVLLPAFISMPRLILLAGLLAATALTVWPRSSLLPELQKTDDTTVIAYVVTAAAVAFIVVRIAAAARSKRRHDYQVLAHTTTRPWARDVIAWAEWRARKGRVALIAATALILAALVAIVVSYGMDEVLYWVALIAFLTVGEAAAHALQTVPISLAARSGRPIALAGAGAVGAILITLLLTMPIASLDHEQLSLTSTLGWSAFVGHVLGATLIGAAIAATLVGGLTRDPLRSAAPIAWTGAATGLASAIVAFAFMTSAPVTAQVADLLLVGWAGGTALWWAPWWRGRQTGEHDGPNDSVLDQDWPDTRRPVPTRSHRRTVRASARKNRRARRGGARHDRRKRNTAARQQRRERNTAARQQRREGNTAARQQRFERRTAAPKQRRGADTSNQHGAAPEQVPPSHHATFDDVLQGSGEHGRGRD
ncbi:patatin-like phospholipase family protein [Agromyces sp. SYSU K20354]|uniref:patatin-like phospholipase family protein n=1 Tax=Agromyces cavernae TaxID=2898659 RepID=UPI001E58C0A6|nr:patatin-like phospholipase family protein [Agromyces cavernae]MCD2443802.1 patatin-like phospholipase family protein [Agromyces cavernae]